MIMRIFQVLARPGKEEEFGRFFHETAIPLMRGTNGIVQVLPGAAARGKTPHGSWHPAALGQGRL